MTTARPVSGWWYLLGVAVLVLGSAGAFIIGLAGVQERVEAMPRGVMPGGLAVQLQPGEYDLYLEEQSVIDGQGYVSTPGVGMRCAVAAEAGGSSVPVVSSSTSSSYTVGAYKGRTLGSFRVDAAGDYRVECEVETPAGLQPAGVGPRVVVAVGAGVAGSIVRTVGFVFGAAIVGVVLLLVVRSKRKKWRLAQQHAAPPVPPTPPPTAVPPGA